VYEVGREIVALFGAPPKLLLRREVDAPKRATISRPFAIFAFFVVKNASDG